MAKCLVLVGAACVWTALMGDAFAQTTSGRADQGKYGTPEAAAKDSFGRPCLHVQASARNQLSNKDIVDHIVSIENRCPKSMHVQVCYVGSTRCSTLDLQPYRRSDTILGTMAKVRFFRYNVTELNASQRAGPTREFTYRSFGF